MDANCESGYTCVNERCTATTPCYDDLDCKQGYNCKPPYCEPRVTKTYQPIPSLNLSLTAVPRKEKSYNTSNTTDRVFIKACGCYKSLHSNLTPSKNPKSKLELNNLIKYGSYCSVVRFKFV